MSRALWGRGRAFLRSYWTPAGKKALANLLGLIFCTAISQACALGVLLLLTYGLPQEGFGAVIFALNLQSYLVAVGTFGLTTIVVRDLTLHPDRTAETITAYLTIVSVASVLVGVVTAVAAAVLPISADERVMLWCIAAGNVAACLNLNPLFDAAHKQALAAALLVPGDLLAVGGVAVLSASDALTVPLVGFVFLGKWALAAVLHAAIYFRAERRLKPRWEWPRLVGQLRSGWPILTSGILYMIPMQGGVLVARWSAGERGTALYGLAVQAAIMYLTLAWLAVRVMYPHMNGAHGYSPVFLKKLAVFCLSVFGGLWVAGVGGGWLLIHSLLRPEYRDVFPLLALLQTAAFFTAFVMITNAYLARAGRERSVVWIYVVAAATYCAVAAVVGTVPLVRNGTAVLVSTVVLSGVSVCVALLVCSRSASVTKSSRSDSP